MREAKYLKTPEAVSEVLKKSGGIRKFSSNDYSIRLETDTGKYITSHRVFRELKDYRNRENERTLGSLTLGDLGLKLSKTRSSYGLSSYHKKYSN